MKEQKIEKIFNKINYNTYKNIEKLSSIIPITTFGLSITIPEVAILTLPTNIACITYQIITVKNKYQNCTKDVTKTKELYKELLELYKKLLIELELSHPTEIYTIYNYMRKKGYLSNGNYFEFGQSNAPEISSDLGINVITGQAVCRNISAMLSDINKTMNINSELLSLYLYNNCEKKEYLNTKQLQSSIKLYEDILDTDNEFEEAEEVLKKLKKAYASAKNQKLPKLKLKIGNHAMTIAEYNGLCYIYDPTNNDMCIKEDIFDYDNPFKSKIISYSGSISELNYQTLNSKNARNNIKNMIILDDAPKEENRKIITNTNRLIKDNLDMLERFRQENKELYGDIDNSLRKIRKRKGII